MRTTLTQIMIFGVFGLSLNLLFGYTGLFSLGHAAFFGVAAYATAILAVQLDIRLLWVLLPVGVLFATITAALMGLVALRVSGVYFLFVTLALGELLAAVALKWVNLTGGSNGIFGVPYPTLGLPVPIRAQGYYFIVLAIFLVCVFALYRITHSSFGLILQGIRDDEKRMQHLGYNTWLYKYAAFVISGFFAGAAGVMFAPFVGTVVPAYLGTATSALLMLMVIIGSAHLFAGPVIGAAIVLFLQYYISIWIPARWPLVLGLIFVISVLFLPGGVGQYLDRWWRNLRFEKPTIEVPQAEEVPEHV
ncbi:MAG: branched-chain amino acid ABC transporter permease [Anaerolineae bacterium]